MNMKKISVLTLVSVLSFNGVVRADYDDALRDLAIKTQAAQSACAGIKKDLDTIFGLSVATTVSSGLGTVAAGAALATGIAKSKTDKKLEDIKLLELRTGGLTETENVEEFKKQARAILGDLDADIAQIQKDTEELEKKSKLLGNVRTGLMAGATVTSAVSMGTSIGATVNAAKLADKMADCNKAVSALRLARATAEAEEVEETDATMAKAGEILASCTGYDESNISALRKLSKANAIVSGIGTVSAGAGTVTSAMANGKDVRAAGGKKEKNLNLASNILAGVTAGTSGTSTVLSAIQISKAKKDSEMADVCESAL